MQMDALCLALFLSLLQIHGFDVSQPVMPEIFNIVPSTRSLRLVSRDCVCIDEGKNSLWI